MVAPCAPTPRSTPILTVFSCGGNSIAETSDGVEAISAARMCATRSLGRARVPHQVARCIGRLLRAAPPLNVGAQIKLTSLVHHMFAHHEPARGAMDAVMMHCTTRVCMWNMPGSPTLLDRNRFVELTDVFSNGREKPPDVRVVSRHRAFEQRRVHDRTAKFLRESDARCS